jgi:hypothetical protein
MAMKAYGLRKTLVSGEDLPVALFSNVIYNSTTKEATFWIPKNRLEKMLHDDWHFAPIRVDSWIPMAMPEPLKPK